MSMSDTMQTGAKNAFGQLHTPQKDFQETRPRHLTSYTQTPFLF
jgi:hypothetical protein